MGSSPVFSATFTTIAFDESSLRWLEINTWLPTSKGLPSSPIQLRTVTGTALVTQDPTRTFHTAARGHCCTEAEDVPVGKVITSVPVVISVLPLGQK
jgi:hypothetical protein